MDGPEVGVSGRSVATSVLVGLTEADVGETGVAAGEHPLNQIANKANTTINKIDFFSMRIPFSFYNERGNG